MPSAPTKSPEPSISSRIEQSAQKLERDIRARGLKPGDRYLTAQQAGQLLGESVTTAQRAMAFLAKGNILQRRPKAGTFVGQAMAVQTSASCVHFLMPEQMMHEGNDQSEDWCRFHGIRSVLPHLSVQFNFIPNHDMDRTKQVVQQASATGAMMGMVLILPSREMRTYFNQSGIPTVILGGIESDLSNLCWLDMDQSQMGRLFATHLIQRGHRRLVTIMRDVWSIGEHMLHDGISEALVNAELAPDALRIRSTPPEHSAITTLIHDLLTDKANAPTGFICRTKFQADCVGEVVDRLGMSGCVEIALCNTLDLADRSKYICAIPTMDAADQGRLIGTMLKSMTQGQQPEPRGQHISVELSTPT